MNALVDVYGYKKVQRGVKLLVLRRSPGVIYGGQWRMVGGKIQKEEKAHAAALREFTEETNLSPSLFWALPSVNSFYDIKADAIRHIPAFAAEVEPGAPIKLNHEHCEWKWITRSEIGAHIHWPEQQRLMKLLISIVTDNQLLDEWIIHDRH